MKTILLIFLLIASGIHCQEELPSTKSFYFGKWSGDDYRVPEGGKAYVFADACNVRKEPGQDAEIAGKLFVGTLVKILERTPVTLTLNGVESTWLKIKSDTIVGYVWGGTLTNDLMKFPNKLIAVWGVTKYVDSDLERKATISVRIVQNKAVVSSVDFEVDGAQQPNYGQLEQLEKPMLDSVDFCMIYKTYVESCGVYSTTDYLIISGKKIKHIGSGYDMADGDQLNSFREMLFPISSESLQLSNYYYTPQKNQVIIFSSDGERAEDCIWREKIEVEVFDWKNMELVRFCQ